MVTITTKTQIFIDMNSFNYRVIIRKEPEGTYTAIVPTLKGCITWGETIEEAMTMAREAIMLMREAMQAKGVPIPDDSETVEYTVNITDLIAA